MASSDIHLSFGSVVHCGPASAAVGMRAKTAQTAALTVVM
jgi:hypothetical protein